MKKEILLFQPEVPVKNPNYLPYSLLPVAGVLEEEGYKVGIVDTRFEDYRKLNLDDVIFCGITSLTGLQIHYGLKISQWIRSANPSTKIVWGGIHSSLLPLQTCAHPMVDVVVKGEGEETIRELAHALEDGKSLEGVRGAIYKEDGHVKDNPDRPWVDMNQYPLPPYHLLKRDQYFLDTININTSRGCPYQCTFCFNRSWNKKSYRYQDPQKVVEQIKYAKEWFPQAELIGFTDDNFFVKHERVKEICRGLISDGVGVRWTAMCRANYIVNFDEEMFVLLKRSGFKGFGIGGESGSLRVLKHIKKGITPEMIVEAVRRCGEHGLVSNVSFMVGFPTETIEDVHRTLDIIDEMRRANPKAKTNGIFVLTPYPGTEAFDEAVVHGFKPPQTLDGWGLNFFSDPNQNPWYTEEYRELLEVLRGLSWIIFSEYSRFHLSPRYFLMTPLKFLLKASAHIRWRLRYFNHAYEWKAYNWYVRRRGHL
ncbi:MAG: radical SAM protein [Candidatus Hydrothermarchaeota archaeon]